jgi:hypothetical protein
MRFVWFDKTEYEADIIVSILKKEEVRFTIKSESEQGINMFGCPFSKERFNIEVNVSLEYWDYLNKLISERAVLYKNYDLNAVEHPPVNEEYLREKAEPRIQSMIDKLFKSTRVIELQLNDKTKVEFKLPSLAKHMHISNEQNPNS